MQGGHPDGLRKDLAAKLPCGTDTDEGVRKRFAHRLIAWYCHCLSTAIDRCVCSFRKKTDHVEATDERGVSVDTSAEGGIPHI